MKKYQIREHLELNLEHALVIKYHVYELITKIKVVKKWFKKRVITSEQYEPITYRTGCGSSARYYEFDSKQKAKQFIHDYKLTQHDDLIVDEV